MLRIVEKICSGVGVATRFFSPNWRLSFDRTDFSRTDDTLRRATFCPTRIFIFRNARRRDPRRLEKFRPQKISIRPAGSLAGVKILHCVATGFRIVLKALETSFPERTGLNTKSRSVYATTET